MAESLIALIDRKNQRIEDIPLEFQSSVEKVQRKIFDRITELITQLDVKDGQIVMSEANLLRVEQINDELKKVLNGREYTEAVRDFVAEFNTQKALNDKYFKQAFGSSVTGNALANQLVRNSQRNAFDLLYGSQAEDSFLTPVKGQLENAVSSGASYSETVQALRESVEGTDETDGKLLRYSKQVSWDAFALSDRAYTNAVADDIEIEWYRYSGGIVKDSRCFCEERDGEYFHYKEIEAFGRGQELGECNTGDGGWQGQMAGTNESTIFIVAGGYNCRHTWSPVSIVLVPRDVILRNMASGNFEPNDFERKELNL